MGLSGSQKKLLLLVLAFACLSSYGAEAWSSSWSSGSGWGYGSDGSSSSSSGPGSDSDGSSSSQGSSPGWGWGWGWIPGWGWGWGWIPGWGSSGSDNSGSGSGSNSHGSGWGWGFGSDGSSGSGSGSGSGTTPDGTRWSWSWSPRTGWRWSWGSNNDNSSSSGSGSVLDSDNKASRKIVVGGSDGWTKGLNYNEWASKNAPFYVDDVLVFKYDKHAKRRNNVYLFQDPWSYMNCNIKNAMKIGSTKKGSEESFKFTLNKLQPYFFASGENEGDYCSNHNMKFTIFPIPHRSD